jgi:hypothetical protein
MKRITTAIQNAPGLSPEFKADAMARINQDEELAHMVTNQSGFKSPDEDFGGHIAARASQTLTLVYMNHSIPPEVGRDLCRDFYVAFNGAQEVKYETR